MQKKLTLDTTVALKSENRSGSNYLNALLFARYRRQLWKKLRTRLFWVIGLGGGLLIALKLFAVRRSDTDLWRHFLLDVFNLAGWPNCSVVIC